MSNFNRENRSSGGRKFGGRTQMHRATCSNCGKDCEVPFRPTGEKPVYCRECFNKEGGNNAKRSFGRNNNRFSDRRPAPSMDNEQLKSINNKLDQIIRLLTPKKESYDQKPEQKSKEKKQKKEKPPVLLAETTPITKVAVPTEATVAEITSTE